MEIFQNRLLVSPQEAGAAIGFARQTVNNLLHQKKFPIPVFLSEGRRVVRVTDLKSYVLALPPEAPKKRAGRRRKVEKMRDGGKNHA